MKRTCLIIICCIVAQMAVAQCKITITLSVSGCSNTLDGRIAEKVAEAQANHYLEQAGIGFNSLQECNAFRSMVISQSYSYGNCRVRFNVSPCTGCPSGAAGDANILAIGQGSSFYSVNGAEEIRNWSEDDMERMIALNKEYQDMTPSMLTTGDDELDQRLAMLNDNNHDLEDYMIVGGARIPVSVLNKPFVSVNMREDLNKVEMANDFSYLANKENVQKYVDYCQKLSDLFLDLEHPFDGDLTMLLHQKFRDASNFDVDVIMQMLPSQRSDEEKQALIDYQAFRKEVTDKIIADINDKIAQINESEGYREYEMAILADNCYTNSKGEFIQDSNYQRVLTNFLSEGDPITGLSSLIDNLNSTYTKTGFHAEIYYNKITNEYTLAFEGTNQLRDAITDYELATGKVPEQYHMANKIAEYINSPNFSSNIRLNITGHSLGGGLASIVGLSTGKPTYTFNAAGISRNVISTFGLNKNVEDKVYNIKAFQAKYDMVTLAQESVVGKAVSNVVASGISVVLSSNPFSDEGRRLQTEISRGNIAAATIGDKKKIEGGGIHFMSDVVKKFMDKNTDKTYSMKQYSYIQKNLHEKGHSVEYQTQESILILTES